MHKYDFKLTPEVELDSKRLRAKIVSKAEEALKAKVGAIVFQGGCTFYGSKMDKDAAEIEVSVDAEHTYKLKYEWVQTFKPGDSDHTNFIKCLLNKVVRGLRFEVMGRKYFNAQDPVKINDSGNGLSLLTGFDPRVVQKEGGLYLNIEPCFRILREETALDCINACKNMAEKRRGPYDWKAEAEEALKFSTICLS